MLSRERLAHTTFLMVLTALAGLPGLRAQAPAALCRPVTFAGLADCIPRGVIGYMARLVFLTVVALVVMFPRAVSACTCVVDPDKPFAIQPASKGVFAIGTVKQIRSEANPGFHAIVVEITEPILNASAGDVITFLTRTSDEACGYSGFSPGGRYVIESSYFVPAAPSPDPIDRKVLEELWGGVPAGSHIVWRCGKTRPLNTPEGDKALGEIREAVRQLRR